MIFLIGIAAIVAIVVVLYLIDRSPVTQRPRRRILERDRAWRDSQHTPNPWEPEREDAWPHRIRRTR